MKKRITKRQEKKSIKKMEKMVKECVYHLKQIDPERYKRSVAFSCDILFEGDKHDTFIVEGLNGAGFQTCSVNVKVFDGGKWEIIK